jgi:hypothetical protein
MYQAAQIAADPLPLFLLLNLGASSEHLPVAFARCLVLPVTLDALLSVVWGQL